MHVVCKALHTSATGDVLDAAVVDNLVTGVTLAKFCT